MKLLLLSILSFFYMNSYAQWIELNAPGINQHFNNMPPMSGAVTFTMGNSVYYGTGTMYFSSASSIYYNDFYKYDILTGNWQPAPQISNGFNARKNASAFTHNGKAYVGFGENNSDFDDLWEIDPQSGTISQKASIPGGRHNALTFVSGSKAYAGGGYIGNIGQLDFYSYDFSNNTWTSKNALPQTTLFFTNRYILEIDGQGYMLTYRDSTGLFTNSFDRYDTLNDSWIPCSPYPGIATRWAKGFAINDQGFLGFGTDSANNPLSEFYQYDVLNDTWIQKNSYSDIRDQFCNSFSNGIKAGFICANGNAFEYDVVTDSWQETVGKPLNISGERMLVLNNKAYGWKNIYDISNDSWIYDSTMTISWRFKIGGTGYGFYNAAFTSFDPTLPVWPPLAITSPPPGLSTFFSIGNKGYAGDFYSNPTNGFWEFDPSTQQWTRKADFPGPKRECGGGFSIGNNGYITGGWCDSIGWYIYDFWQYNPISDSWTSKSDGPTGYIGSFMEGDATRGYVGLGIWDPVGSDNGDVSVYNPATDIWSTLPGLPPRHSPYSFIANDELYVGGGITRYSQIDAVTHYDFYKLPLSGINTVNEKQNISSLQIYPNPSSGVININNLSGKSIVIYNYNGEKLFTMNINSDALRIDLREKLAAGCYFISLQDHLSVKAMKFIILP